MTMNVSTDFDNPAVEEQWCETIRGQVSEYLAREGVVHGRVGEWPAWYVAPYVSIWAIESRLKPDAIGWWAICGDLPTDYISADKIHHPRDAMRAIADRWRNAAELMACGKSPADFMVGSPPEWPNLAPLLASRAMLLLKWVNDSDIWNELD
jgi:hypothetical protein